MSITGQNATKLFSIFILNATSIKHIPHPDPITSLQLHRTASVVLRQTQSRFSHVPKYLCFPFFLITTNTRFCSRILGNSEVEVAYSLASSQHLLRTPRSWLMSNTCLQSVNDCHWMCILLWVLIISHSKGSQPLKSLAGIKARIL